VARELASEIFIVLRDAYRRVVDAASRERTLRARGKSIELQLEISGVDKSPVGVKVLASPDGREETSISYDPVTKELVVDLRSGSYAALGRVPGAVFIPRNVLEWRCDPACPSCDERLTDLDGQLIVMCNEGYQSSLAAATLTRFGLDATDVIGGFQAWRKADLPVRRT
jgi:rhodanese-related sulfurtransferase